MEKEIDRNIFIFILASVILITLPHINNIPISIFIFFNSLVLWRFCAVWDKKWLPKKWFSSLITVVGIFLLYSQHQGVFGRDAGTSIFIVALGLKVLETTKEKDLYLISYLAFIVATTLFLYSQSILMIGYIALVTCSLLTALIAVNTKITVTQNTVKKSVIIIAQALPMAFILFFLFPRVNVPDWISLNKKNKVVSGISDKLRPGSISQIGVSNELAFRVKFKDKVPPPEQLYWRGPVFSYTDGLNWTETNNRSFLRRMDDLVFNGKPYQYTLMMEPQDGHWIFSLDMPTAYPKKLIKNGLFQLLDPETEKKREEYEITSYLNFNTGKLTDTEYADNTQIPRKPMPEITQLVNELQGKNGSPASLINGIFKYFKDNGFYYTLSPPVMEVNPIETFLFKARSGFCGHYATAFVYLLRVAKIPARVVAGYQGGKLNKVGGFLEVRQSDAHAWAEVWMEDKGWVRFDPTVVVAPDQFDLQNENENTNSEEALNNIKSKGDNGFLEAWVNYSKDAWNNVDYEWQQWIIHYRGEEQSNILSSFGIKGMKSMFYWLFGLMLLVLGVFAWFILNNQKSKKDKELIVYQRFCDRLAKIGVVKMKGETAYDFALRARELRPDLSGSIASITSMFISLRYERNAVIEDFQKFKKQVNLFKV